MKRFGGCAALVLTLCVPTLASAQPFHLEDTLRGTTSGNATGGSFGTDGWTVTAATDRIWYALPTLASGYVELTLAHVTPANLPLGDQEVFAMYEDGYGLGEPLPYGPFRDNHYKVLVRIYGMVEPGRMGSMKLMWGMCPSGDPGHDTCGCDSFFGEPFGTAGEWTGDPVRLRIEWGDGHSRLLRDGAEVVSVDWSASGLTFGPSDLHMMIGSPRNDGGLSGMPIGATFSDLVVDGVQGPLATCPSGTSDAGTPIDAGMCSSVGAITQDATAALWEPGVFPDANDLNVEGDTTASTAIVYLRFPAITGSASHASLTLHTATGGSAGGGSGQVCRVDGASWDESSLTWTNRPAVSTACSGGAHTVGAGETVTWDVTSLVSSGVPIDLAIVSTDGDGVHYLSRESGGCANGPSLDITLAPVVDGGSSADASAAMDAAPSTDAASDGAARMDASGADSGARGGSLSTGCGCGVARTHDHAPWLGMLVLALVMARRRQPRIIDSSSILPSR